MPIAAETETSRQPPPPELQVEYSPEFRRYLRWVYDVVDAQEKLDELLARQPRISRLPEGV